MTLIMDGPRLFTYFAPCSDNRFSKTKTRCAYHMVKSKMDRSLVLALHIHRNGIIQKIHKNLPQRKLHRALLPETAIARGQKWATRKW